jgi:hypothetical protein
MWDCLHLSKHTANPKHSHRPDALKHLNPKHIPPSSKQTDALVQLPAQQSSTNSPQHTCRPADLPSKSSGQQCPERHLQTPLKRESLREGLSWLQSPTDSSLTHLHAYNQSSFYARTLV